jgi:hypothetical protein
LLNFHRFFLLEGLSPKEKHKLFHPHFKKMKQKLLLIAKSLNPESESPCEQIHALLQERFMLFSERDDSCSSAREMHACASAREIHDALLQKRRERGLVAKL